MKTHRDLLAWQKARAVARGVIELSISSWKPQFGAVFDQVQRSSLSAQINVAEGYAFFSDSAHWRNHLRIAYGSAIETGDLLELMAGFDHFGGTPILTVVEACKDSQQLLFGLMRKYGALKVTKP
jgi:four helix bundle protein